MTLFTHLNFQLFCRPPNCMALCLTNSRYLAISRFLQYNLYSIKNTNLTLGFIDLIYQPVKFCLTKKQHKIFKFHTIFCDCVHSPPSNSSQTHPHLLTETIYTFSLPFYLERSLYISVHIVQFVLFNYSWELGLPWDVINLPEVNHNFINKEKNPNIRHKNPSFELLVIIFQETSKTYSLFFLLLVFLQMQKLSIYCIKKTCTSDRGFPELENGLKASSMKTSFHGALWTGRTSQKSYRTMITYDPK